MKRPARHLPGTLLAGAAVLLPLAAASAGPPAETSARFSPPASRLTLSRTLRSPLADGREIVARRTYALSIVPDGEGFRVNGEEIGCTVEAPESLASLAALERRRSDAGPFPLHLDRNGMVLTKPSRIDNAPLHRASDLADSALEKTLPDPSLRLALLDLVATLSAGNQTAWPEDLFRPAATHRVDRRAIALPDGTRGEIEVEIVSEPGSEESTRVQRTVTTALGTSRRTTREEWVLAPTRAR